MKTNVAAERAVNLLTTCLQTQWRQQVKQHVYRPWISSNSRLQQQPGRWPRDNSATLQKQQQFLPTQPRGQNLPHYSQQTLAASEPVQTPRTLQLTHKQNLTAGQSKYCCLHSLYWVQQPPACLVSAMTAQPGHSADYYTFPHNTSFSWQQRP